jgi:uncharacterized membrane protein
MNRAIALAFLMTLITASTNIALKKGFHRIPPFIATYISVLISTVFLWVTTFLFVPRGYFLNYKGILVFIIIGLFAPTLVRTMTYYGIHTLGAGRSTPLRAMTPFFATIMAIIFLKESPHPIIFLGISLIVLGVAILAKKEEKDFVQWKPKYFIYPIAAAILAGLAANLRKYGLDLMPQPIFASAVAATSSLVILTIYVILRFRDNQMIRFHHKRELRFIIIAAFLTSIGEVVDLAALLYGKVSLVVPIFAVTPLTVVFFSWIFLKEQEVVTKRLVLSTIIILFGIYISIVSAK